jgi:hypothetical protein
MAGYLAHLLTVTLKTDQNTATDFGNKKIPLLKFEKNIDIFGIMKFPV